MRVFLFIVCLCTSFPAAAQTDEDGSQGRLALAQKMLNLQPVRDQVRSAIDQYIQTYMAGNSPAAQEGFRSAMMAVLNYKTLERLSLDAYADIFTQEELAAMVEYYSKPEAISARAKLKDFNGRIYPEIIRMLDQALMRARTQMQQE